MEKLKVCLMNDSFPPAIDGVANAVTNYADIITREHGSAAVVTPYYPDADDSVYPYPVLRYPSIDTTKLVGYRAGVPFDPDLMEDLEKRGFDIIHSHCPITSTLLARGLREQINKPVVFTYHTKFDIDIANAVSSKLLQEEAAALLVANITACDEVWTVSRGAGENLRKLGYQGDYRVMPNGVDFPQGRVDEALIAEVTEGFDLPEGLPVFLFVGRMMWYKGIRIILDALKLLKEEGRWTGRCSSPSPSGTGSASAPGTAGRISSSFPPLLTPTASSCARRRPAAWPASWWRAAARPRTWTTGSAAS